MLEWLLLAGNNVVVSDYSVIYNLNSLQRQYSRTGEALMKFKSGDSYKVDAKLLLAHLTIILSQELCLIFQKI